ncbi:TPR repeat-containing thioredoxin TTL1-like protein [Corchorus olitorius]|uniref:TPR repeat-containing thioredoxin TTL1-like protein n=1 Tax=Corchorus olitorius TaxID=93759 RepID=A0A1R3GXF5_9ROSI|nr:TPR repeat-containing thioredoxin TTL1-like protein [Corchorus olitorius]
MAVGRFENAVSVAEKAGQIDVLLNNVSVGCKSTGMRK